ncbi:hypothetical protein ANO11243_022930 [Dothideomycetidae sp. 11243]|nr:hypothetical protein ANO11243_022930 [fungal sp. No.11243]
MVMVTDFSEGPLPNPLFCNPPPRPKTPPPPPPPEPEPEAEPEQPKKPAGPYRADAARREFQPKKNTGDAAKAAAAAKALAGKSRLQNQPSMSSLHLGSFPLPGQAVDPTAVRPGSILSEDGSECPTPLGAFTPSRSVAQLTNFNEFGRAGSLKAPSIKSGGSGGKHDKLVGSLGDSVGFTFKATCNFVHPNRQLPRQSRSRQASVAQSVGYEDEDEADMVERMNSVTSDGGWKSGWSVAGSNNGSISGPSGERFDIGPDEDLDQDDFEGPDTIYEEQEDGDMSPSRPMSPVRMGTNDGTGNMTRPGRSLKSRKSSLSIRLRSNRDDPDATNTSAATSPVRTSFDRAISMLGKSMEPEDPISRAANIAAARKAFEEKEAAKDRKWAEQEAKKEERRRRSEALERSPSWKRRPSNAVDSAAESIEEKSAANGFTALNNATFINQGRPFAFDEDDESCDPFAPAPASEQYSTAQDALFPEYQETQEVDHSMFSAAFQEPQQLQQQQEESTLFPPLRSPIEEEKGGLFPPPQQSQYYLIDGVMYDEYGMPIEDVPPPMMVQDDMSGYADAQGRRLSKTKQAKGKINKFSAWGKTRMLRV